MTRVSDEGSSPFKHPLQWLFRSSLLVLGAMLALTYSVELLRGILPWLVGIGVVVALVWVVIVVIRWRRAQW